MYRETEQSERLYSKVAARYDNVFERAILSEGRLTELARETMDGRRVLDLACGNGRWLERFTPREYVGLNLNEQMLGEARKRYGQKCDVPSRLSGTRSRPRFGDGRQGCPPHFIRGDMTTIPFADGSFDGVISMFGAMGHLPREGQERMIREVHRVLAPDGVAILTNGNLWSPFVLPTTLTGNRVRLEGLRFKVHSTTPNRFTAMLRGFRLLRLESYDHSFIPLLPIKFGACILGLDYRRGYERTMDIYNHCRYILPLRWFGKQLVAVCQKA